MLIRTDPDVLMIKSEELQNLANRMVRYTDELYEIESGMRRMSSLAECVISVSAQIGRLTEEAGIFAGLLTGDANKPIAEHLEKTGALFALKKIIHQYPHCWRCKKPVLFRATKQWF